MLLDRVRAGHRLSAPASIRPCRRRDRRRRDRWPLCRLCAGASGCFGHRARGTKDRSPGDGSIDRQDHQPARADLRPPHQEIRVRPRPVVRGRQSDCSHTDLPVDCGGGNRLQSRTQRRLCVRGSGDAPGQHRGRSSCSAKRGLAGGGTPLGPTAVRDCRSAAISRSGTVQPRAISRRAHPCGWRWWMSG